MKGSVYVFHPTGSRSAASRAVTIIVLGACATLGLSAPAQAKPSPQQIEKQIDTAWNKLEPIIEEYNRVHAQLQANRTEQVKLATTLKPLQIRVDAALSDVGQMATRVYMQGGRPGLSTMLISGGSNDLTDKLTYLDLMARRQRASVSTVITLRDRYAADKRKLDSVTADLATRDAALATQRTQIQKQVDALQK